MIFIIQIIGSSAYVAAREIVKAYPGAVSEAAARYWFKKFKAGDKSLKQQKGGGRTKIFSDDELKNLVDEYPHLTLEEYGRMLGVTKSTLSRRLQAINYTCKRTLWTPHQLSAHNLSTRVNICAQLIEKNKTDPFLKYLMTSDESYILYETPYRRNEWSIKGAVPANFPKGGLHPKKIMLCVWWDAEGIIYREFLNTTVDSDKYCAQLLEVRKSLLKKRPAHINRDRVYFQHDNARPHIANKTKALLDVFKWDVLPHPPYSPDIAPSDFHLFLHLKIALRGQKFKNTDELIKFVDDFFASKAKSFYRDGIYKLEKLWPKIIENDGKYL